MNIPLHLHPSEASFDWLKSLPRQILARDWYGNSVEPPVLFSFGLDEEHLWFLAERRKAARFHPEGMPGTFTPELWKYDVAEWFLLNPGTGAYWEFNLSPNGAWWACAFRSARRADDSIPAPRGISSLSETNDGSWLTMARIPLDDLAPIVSGKPGADALDGCKLAATFIQETPVQIFLTTAEPCEGEPDFHRPQCFGSVEFVS